MSFSNHSSDREMVEHSGHAMLEEVHDHAGPDVATTYALVGSRGTNGRALGRIHVQVRGDKVHSRRDVQDSV